MRSDTFKSKLASYSALASSLLAFGKFADAQIVYTDIFPDDTLNIIPSVVEEGIVYDSTYALDLNNDGIVDFKFSYFYWHFLSSSSCSRSKVSAAWVLQYNSNKVAGSTPWEANAYALDSGDTISPTMNWINQNWAALAVFGTFADTCVLPSNSWTSSYGFWLNKVDGFVGLKLVVNTDTLYGWIRMDVSIKKHVIIKDYAYDSIPNESVASGSTFPLGIFDQKEKSLTLFPNPAHTTITLQLPSNKPSDITIINTLGEEVMKQHISSPSKSIALNVAALAAGAYFIVVRSDSDVFTGKFVKQ